MGFVEAINVIELSLAAISSMSHFQIHCKQNRSLSTSANHQNWLLMKCGKTTANSTFHLCGHNSVLTFFSLFLPFQPAKSLTYKFTHAGLDFISIFQPQKNVIAIACISNVLCYTFLMWTLWFNATGNVAAIMLCHFHIVVNVHDSHRSKL